MVQPILASPYLVASSLIAKHSYAEAYMPCAPSMQNDFGEGDLEIWICKIKAEFLRANCRTV
jgi:hypothetical protein